MAYVSQKRQKFSTDGIKSVVIPCGEIDPATLGLSPANVARLLELEIIDEIGDTVTANSGETIVLAERPEDSEEEESEETASPINAVNAMKTAEEIREYAEAAGVKLDKRIKNLDALKRAFRENYKPGYETK